MAVPKRFSARRPLCLLLCVSLLCWHDQGYAAAGEYLLAQRMLPDSSASRDDFVRSLVHATLRYSSKYIGDLDAETIDRLVVRNLPCVREPGEASIDTAVAGVPENMNDARNEAGEGRDKEMMRGWGEANE